MPSNRFTPKFVPLRFDSSAAFLPNAGMNCDDLIDLAPRLEAGRREVLVDQSADAESIALPARLLAEYPASRTQSELGRIMATAKRLAESVDRVVVLGDRGLCLGARALFEACCHPYHNELGRGDRGGRPRMYFAGDSFDNDAIQGLLDLLGHGRRATTIDDRWAVIVFNSFNPEPTATAGDTSGETLETAVALRAFLGPLGDSCGGDPVALARLIVPVAGSDGQLLDLAKAFGCPDLFTVPGGAGGASSVLTAAGLLPAAVLGLDVFRMLEGAAAMIERFRTMPPGDNPPLDFAAVCHLLEKHRGTTDRRFAMGGRGLDAAAAWYDQLVTETGVGNALRGVPNARRSSPSRNATEGVPYSRDSRPGIVQGFLDGQGRGVAPLIVNLIVDQVRRDRLSVPRSQFDHDPLNELASKSLPELQTVAIQRAKQAHATAGQPAADLHLPAQDESALGQFFQMMLLATAVELRLAVVAGQ